MRIVFVVLSHAVFIVMCAILRVVAYFLSDMYTLFRLYVWHPHFPLNGNKEFLVT